MNASVRGGRGTWGSKLAFVLAAAGSAIGLGNIWGFPMMVGMYGGAVFVLVYLLCVLALGVPVMMAELTIGRKTKNDPVGAFKQLAPSSPWRLVGVLGVVTGLVILSYYSVVAGWTVRYLWVTATQGIPSDPREIQEAFTSFLASPWPLLYHAFFMVVTIWVVMGGVEGGIERITKILMPFLSFILVLLVLRSVTLEGAWKGVEFYLRPDLSKIDFSVILAAMGQAFFSLSLGMGAMITYGSYLSDEEDLASSAVYVSLSDLLVAFLAGLAIFPALFAVPGLQPDEGPALIFLVLPNIFNAIPFGQVFGVAFYLLLAIAALTSAISLLEVVVAYFIDQRGWHRKTAAWVVGLGAFCLGIPSALGEGYMEFFAGFLGAADFWFGKLALVVGGLLICLFVGWRWGIDAALAEIRRSNSDFRLGVAWGVLVRFFCPLAIAVILVHRILSVLF